MSKTTFAAERHSWSVILAFVTVAVTGSPALAALPQPGDLVFGHSDFDAPDTLELVRGSAVMNGGMSQPDPWDATVVSAIDLLLTSAPIQSVEFDNFGGIGHNASGNLLGLNFGSSNLGGEIFSFGTTVDPAPSPQSIGHTMDLDFGPTRLGGLSVSPDNTKIAVTGYDNGRLIVFDYTAGDTMGMGASLSGGRESGPLFIATDTQGSAWLDNNTVLAFASDGMLYEVNATSMAHSLVKDVSSPLIGGEFTSLAYNPAVSPYVYASKSSFVNPTTTNALFILDPRSNYDLVKQLNLSTSLSNTAREIALDQDGNLFISVFGGDVNFIVDADNPAALTDNSPVVWFESAIPSGFNGIDVGFGPPVEGVLGDYNDNGTVDAADYVLWRKGGPLMNEGDNPGTVDQGDFSFWRSRFGATSGSGSGLAISAVPEPAAIVLCVLGMISISVIGRRCQK